MDNNSKKYDIYAIVQKNVDLHSINPNDFKHAYIGYTSDFNTRMKSHIKRTLDTTFEYSKKLYNRLRSHGWDEYNKIILETVQSEKEAKAKEIEMISQYNTFEKGLNSTPGGEGGIPFGVDNPNAEAVNIYNNTTKEILSFGWMKGAADYLGIDKRNISTVVLPYFTCEQTFSPLYNAWYQVRYAYDDTPFIEDMPTPGEKMSQSRSGEKNYLLGGHLTDETKQKLSDALSGPKHPMFDKKHKPETIQKMRDVKTGKVLTETTKKKISDAHIGKSAGDKNPRAKFVYAFGNVYSCGTIASDALRPIFRLKRNFIKDWTKMNSRPDVFWISKDVYESYII